MSEANRFDSPFGDASSPSGWLSRFFKGAELPVHYFKQYRKAMTWGLIALVVLDFSELLPPLILKYAVDSILAKGPFRDVVLFAGAYLLVFLVQGLLRYAWRVCLIRSSHQAGRDLRGSFVHRLFHLHPGFFEKNRVGDLMALANSDVDAIRQFVGPGILVLADALFYLAFVPIAMLWLDWKLALISFATLPLIPWIAYRLEELIHDRFKASQDQFSTLSAMAQENLNGIRVVKALAVEDVQHERFRKLGEKYVELNLKLARADKSFGPVMDFFTSLGIVLLLWFGGRWVIEDSLTLGTFVAFQRYIQKMVWPMIAIGFGASMYQRSSASSKRLKQIFQTPNQVPDAHDPAVPEATTGHIRIQNLSFRYPGSEGEVLRNLSLEIQPGTRVAFVGSIGSGKSTLLSLIPRLYPVPEGTLFVDSIDVNHWPLDELRRRIGMVPQEVFLFSETLRENLLFGVEEEDPIVRETRVQEVLRVAHLQDDILSLPLQENTPLGERGVNLSGGQKQRVSLGRALAREPDILILDDSLSAVDVRTEQRILSELRNRGTRKTELIAAHRISTVQDADLIVVLDRGEIVQQGTHAELIQVDGVYRSFHEQQRLEEELEAFLDQLPSESSAAEEEVQVQ